MAKKLSCCSFVLTPDRGAVPVDSLRSYPVLVTVWSF